MATCPLFEAPFYFLRHGETETNRLGLTTEDDPDQMFRVSVLGGGCSGFQYKFGFDRARNPDDIVIEKDGVTVLIDEVSAGYMGGAEIDFVTELMGASFQVRNPKAASSCGCGTSFSLG